MEQEQREFILSEYKKLIDAYDNNTNKYSEAQWNAVRKFYDAHNEYPKDTWWDEEAGDWAYLNDNGEIDHPKGVQYFPLPWG